ncbi:MAG: hypothetical protein AAGI07_12490, partial [Bacteroidota bacterium]
MNKHANGVKNRKWLFSKSIDILFLLLPVWVCWLVCFSLPESILYKELPLWFWVVFILGIDVSHVWSTIFRTYLDKEEFELHKTLLLFTPFVAFLFLFCLAFISHLWFWRFLAYLALYHFIKQQYGFLALYKAKFKQNLHQKILQDKWVIYFSMVYPVIFWHLSGNRVFNWFVQGDFFIPFTKIPDNLYSISTNIGNILQVANILYWMVIATWLAEEVLLSLNKKQPIAIGKILWLVTTACNWYLGIVYFNSDIAFSLTNVVAHGIPYIVLIFFYVEKKKQVKQKKSSGLLKGILNISLMLILI